MQSVQLLLPAIATAALGTALLVPLRDERGGRRATIGLGGVPFRPEFAPRASTASAHVDEVTEPTTLDAARIDEEQRAPDAAPITEAIVEEKRAASAASLLDPFSAIELLARPLTALRAACSRFIIMPPRNVRDADDSELGTGDVVCDESVAPGEHVTERSFAAEVASLLHASQDGVSGASSIAHDSATVAEHAPDPLVIPNAPAVEPAEPPTELGFTVAPLAHRANRVVPITRLPLRRQGVEVTWTAEVSELESAGQPSRPQRHAYLERATRGSGSFSSDFIERVYQQEDGDGRALALRIMLRHFPETGRMTFVEALRVGSDEERALAVDGLAALGARDELTPALVDRIDAIAAKAALAYVGSLKRSDYRSELARFVDTAQIESILKLLAGIVE